jgi:hypothetical protein
MTTPFSGMDPYLELPSMWPDVHNRLIVAISDQIQERIAPNYRAVITPYVVFERIEIAPMRAIVPDIGLFEREVPHAPRAPRGGSVAVCEPSPALLTLPALWTIPTEYARVEIRTVHDHVLVTAIEILSPANKRPGEGAESYEKKRQELFQSTAHLLEIDLLRAGKRPQTARPLPNAPYFIFLSRADYRRYVEIWYWTLQQSIPIVPVPLRPPDEPVPLDVGAALHDTYRRARYDLDIDYHQPPPPPELSAEDAAWLDEYLQAAELR